ncbi:MAG: agmatine deiminase family protein [Ignavibacteriae bacterium]|nr:agmatine deiminase family protein [Ignavibacteriota bacterium]
MKYKAIPEWETPKDIYLVNPDCIPASRRNDRYEKICNLYKKLVYCFPGYINVNIFGDSISPGANITVPTEQFKLINLSVDNIWIRDWAPFLARDEAGNSVLMKFIYEPFYQSKSESENGNESAKWLVCFLHLEMYLVPLIVDGGNFTHNGEGIGIVTNRVISDNEYYSIKEIEDIFSKYLGIDKLIFIPVEPGEETGHTDGSVRFIDNKTLLVGDYPAEYSLQTLSSGENKVSFLDLKKSKEFMDKVSLQLQKELGDEYKIVRIKNSIPLFPERKGGIAPAFGNYINYIRLGNKIFLPQYNIPEDLEAVNVLKKDFKDLEIIPVCLDGIKELSFEGGVLNCITWVI